MIYTVSYPGEGKRLSRIELKIIQTFRILIKYNKRHTFYFTPLLYVPLSNLLRIKHFKDNKC